jgi:replicative DNA helicase
VLLIGAPPGAGKTALVLQLAAEVLRHQPDLKVVIGNVEMAPADLLARVAARLAGVSVGRVMDKTYRPGERERVKAVLGANTDFLGRLAFLDSPFSLKHMSATADAFDAKLLVVDYVQRFGQGKELREAVDGLMSDLRTLALAGAAVVAVSSVARQKDLHGRSAYSGLNMASFRGSAELEFGADSAYLLDASGGGVTLKCVKNRYGTPADIRLRFDGEYQRFGPAGIVPAGPPAAATLPGEAK